MNITPTLPNLPQPLAQHPRRGVEAVRAPDPARNATDQSGQHPSSQRVVDESRRARLIAKAEVRVTPQTDHSTRVSRALASYARVVEESERGSLRDVLGFDEYA